MKKLTQIIICAACFALFSCDSELHVNSKLNRDGSLERTIVQLEQDSSDLEPNIFGINFNNGWQIENKIISDSSDDVFTIKRKHFPSIEAANKEMNNVNDTIWQVESKLESTFRWFYTYHRYSDTYAPINRFKHTKIEDYFTSEDLDFIERVDDGALGQADSIYLEYLGDKIFEDYAEEAWLAEIEYNIYSVLDEVGLANMKRNIQVRDLKDNFDSLIDNIVHVAKYLGVPVDSLGIAEKLENGNRELESRIDFMGEATSIELFHSIELPGAILETNAIKIDNNTASWSPRIIKLCLKPYTMYAEYRTLNWLAIIVSGLVVLGSLVFIVKQRK